MNKAKGEYAQKFLDPRWQKKRLEILQRDGWTCCICGDAESTLHIHHRFYVYGRDPWDYDDSILVTLCADCHESEPPVTQCDLLRIFASELGWFCDDIDKVASAFLDSVGMAKHPALASAYAHAIRMIDPDTILLTYLDWVASAECDDDSQGRATR